MHGDGLFHWWTAVHEKRECLQDVTQNFLAVEDRFARLHQRHQFISVVVPIGLPSKVCDMRGCCRKDHWRIVADQHHAIEKLCCRSCCSPILD